MRIHHDWTTPGFAAAPVARHVGPFPGAAFLAVWAGHFDHSGGTVIVEDDRGLLALRHREGTVEFAGHGDVTDYHAPRGDGAAALLAEHLQALPAGTTVRFDSLPEEAAAVVGDGMAQAGVPATRVQHEVAPVISLPQDFDGYLAGLDKKQRHEMRRKRRRFEAALGSPRLERWSGSEAVRRFAAMHRCAGGDKATFMNESMEEFFVDLGARVGGVVDALVTGEGRACAMSFGFEDDDTYYLYNSAYEPRDRDHSPGIVLLELVIRSVIASGRSRLDFLKGDEAYKYRLGAVARPLYLVAGQMGVSA